MSPRLSQSRRRATVSDEYDYKYDSLEDPYVYPGTRILRNKFGIKHQDLLSELESQITDSKFVKSKQSDDDIPTLKHLQAVHKYLFGELYDWAGEIRQQGFISKGQSVFCFAPMIESYSRGIFSKMQRENFPKMDIKQCACKLAYYLSEVNELHPFCEGNGRSTRLFFQIFANEHGWNLSFEKISHVALVEAMIESMNGSLVPLSELLEKCLSRRSST